MANISINVDFSKGYTHQDLISELSPGFEAKSGDIVNFQITLLDPRDSTISPEPLAYRTSSSFVC